MKYSFKKEGKPEKLYYFNDTFIDETAKAMYETVKDWKKNDPILNPGRYYPRLSEL